MEETMAYEPLDPLTFSILSHRLEEVIVAMFHAMVRTSGNSVIYEAGDHQEAVLDANGDTVNVGGGICEWNLSLEAAGKYVVQHFEENPGIYDGDHFMMNHSYICCTHAGDLNMCAPVFWQGQRIAWVVSSGHMIDLGGPSPLSLNPQARDVFAEGLMFSGLKFVEKGVMRKDVEHTIAGMVRQPEHTILDLKAKVAANNVGRERLIDMVRDYGVDTVLTLFEQMKDYSELRVRERLATIPDGKWTEVHYCETAVEPDEPPMRVQLTLTKKGSDLDWDFEGSSPQSQQSQNCALIGAKANALSSYLYLLCWDIPWSSGLWRPLTWNFPEGSCVNATYPQSVSLNEPPGAGYLTLITALNCIAKMMRSSDTTRDDVVSIAGGSCTTPHYSGLAKDGKFFATIVMDGLACGTGASPEQDGMNSGGGSWSPMAQICNVETNEFTAPMLYLWRKETIDSGGPGKFRGGTGPMSAAIMRWDSNHSQLMNYGMGADARMGGGLSGGYPPANTPMGIIVDSNIADLFTKGQIPTEISDIKGKKTRKLRVGEETGPFGLNDVYFWYTGGGGGYGDPLDRDPQLLVRDIVDGFVSVKAAKESYGVVVDLETGAVDAKKTEKLRKKLLEERLKDGKKIKRRNGAKITKSSQKKANGKNSIRVLENLEAVGAAKNRVWRCVRCSSELGPAKEDYRQFVLRRELPIHRGQPRELAPKRWDQYRIREYFCPSCGVMFEVDSVQKGEENPSLQLI
jgi:N-methylhydantoinase B